MGPDRVRLHDRIPAFVGDRADGMVFEAMLGDDGWIARYDVASEAPRTVRVCGECGAVCSRVEYGTVVLVPWVPLT